MKKKSSLPFPPKNQNFNGGITIVMRSYRHNHTTGNRDIPAERVTGRFPAESEIDYERIANFYGERKKIVRRRKPKS